jgi:uncharacterized protein (DUF486 family)
MHAAKFSAHQIKKSRALFLWICSYIDQRQLMCVCYFHPCSLKGSWGDERAVDGLTTRVFQRLYDLRMVRSFEEPIHCTALGAILVSWGIAFFEYTLQVPANRLGFETLSIGQLKVMQEVITLLVFVPFSIYFMQQPLKLDYVWAGLCLVGAVYSVFRA